MKSTRLIYKPTRLFPRLEKNRVVSTPENPAFWLMLIISALVLRLIVAYTSFGVESGFWIEDIKVISSGHTLDFYNYWEPGVYTYPPIWLIILTPIALVNPSVNEIVFLTKIPSIIADVLSSFIIYGICRERRVDGRAPTLAWLFNPLGIYVSSNYGAFDGICVLFSLLSVFLICRKKYVLSAIPLALGVLTKQYVLLTALLLVPLLKNEVGIKKLIKPFLCFSTVVFAVCFPFLISSPEKFLYVISGKAYLEREYLGWLITKPYTNWWHLLWDYRFKLTKLGLNPRWIFEYWTEITAGLTAIFFLLNFKRRNAYEKIISLAGSIFCFGTQEIDVNYFAYPYSANSFNLTKKRFWIWLLPLPAFIGELCFKYISSIFRTESFYNLMAISLTIWLIVQFLDSMPFAWHSCLYVTKAKSTEKCGRAEI